MFYIFRLKIKSLLLFFYDVDYYYYYYFVVVSFDTRCFQHEAVLQTALAKDKETIHVYTCITKIEVL